MHLNSDQLKKTLQKKISPIYLVTGDEPLQLNEHTDAIRSASVQFGYQNRIVLDASQSFQWNDLLTEANSSSLFSQKKLIDLRIPNGKPGRDGSRVLVEYCESLSPDNLLLITLPKLDKQQQNSKWFKKMDSVGVVVKIWPIDAQHLPLWISQRFKQVGLVPENEEVLKVLADHVEGNLLAANQEIEKLRLIYGEGAITTNQLFAVIVDNARYDVFKLVDIVLLQETARGIKILHSLRAEGVAVSVVLWALHREIAQLIDIALSVNSNSSLEYALVRAKVWEKRKGLLRNAIQRKPIKKWLQVLSLCQAADVSIKGLDPFDPWLALEKIIVSACL